MKFNISQADEKKSGIYIIRCKSSHKVYVGQAKVLRSRYFKHKSDLTQKKHTNSHIQNYVNKHDISDLSFDLLELCNLDKLDEREQYWMDYYQCYDINKGFNVAKIAGIQTTLGFKHTDESKKKMSEARRGVKNHFFGKSHHQDTKDKISKANTGKVGWNKGKSFSDDSRKKMSIAKKGKPNYLLKGRKRPDIGQSLKQVRKSKYWLTKRSLDDNQVLEVKRMLFIGYTSESVAKHFLVSRGCIEHIKQNRSFEHIKFIPSQADYEAQKQYKRPKIEITEEQRKMRGVKVLNEEKVREIRKLIAENKLSLKEIAEIYNVNPSKISLIKLGYIWSSVK